MPQKEELLINNDIDSNIEANTINNSWSSLIWSDTKKIIGTAGLLTVASSWFENCTTSISGSSY